MVSHFTPAPLANGSEPQFEPPNCSPTDGAMKFSSV
jgi:hypothetical protein